MKTRAASRSYHSPLRAEQAAQTRERLLEKLAELMVEEDVATVSVADVAERAGVSVRTAYRYFPTRESLFDAFNTWWAARTRSFERPRNVADLPAFAEALFRSFAENETVIRASRWSRLAMEVRARRQSVQKRALAAILQPEVAHLPPDEARVVTAAVYGLVGSDAWMRLRDFWDLNNEEAIRAATWGIRAMLTTLRAEAAAAAKPTRTKKPRRAKAGPAGHR